MNKKSSPAQVSLWALSGSHMSKKGMFARRYLGESDDDVGRFMERARKAELDFSDDMEQDFEATCPKCGDCE